MRLHQSLVRVPQSSVQTPLWQGSEDILLAPSQAALSLRAGFRVNIDVIDPKPNAFEIPQLTTAALNPAFYVNNRPNTSSGVPGYPNPVALQANFIESLRLGGH